jgi:nucleoside phosphorylase
MISDEGPVSTNNESREVKMEVDTKWMVRNMGFDPVLHPMPAGAFSNKNVLAAVTKKHAVHDVDLQREIIDFDSEGAEGKEFLAFSTATGLSRFTDIPWPKGKAPITDKAARKGPAGALPNADVLIVTWTVDEGHALSRVLTPGKDSRNDYVSYKKNFAKIAANMSPRSPARQAGRLGAYWTCKIAGKSVVMFKSDSHMSQDGPKLPNIDVWAQIISDVQPKLVITTGTAGGIGTDVEVGDVVVSPVVRFDCMQKFKNFKFDGTSIAQEVFDSDAVSALKVAANLLAANAGQLPKDNTHDPKIFTTKLNDEKDSVVTTDFFGFDISDNRFGLKGLGHVCEMGDAVLGLAAQKLKDAGRAMPPYIAVRNVSDPQIKAEGTLDEQKQRAAAIYKAFGRWSSVCSAIACWALVVEL